MTESTLHGTSLEVRRTRIFAALVFSLAATLGGCDDASGQASSAPRGALAPASADAEAQAALPGATAFIAAGPEDHVPSPATAGWPGNVEWHSYDDGLAIAKQGKKPILLFVHADWCSKCRALKPVFAQPDFEKLAKDLVMVQQNADEDAPWLEALNEQYGSYVPRIFFLNTDGSVREELKSPSPRYPYFYTVGQASQLQSTMRLALGV